MEMPEIIERARAYTLQAYEDDTVNLGDALAALTAERDALKADNVALGNEIVRVLDKRQTMEGERDALLEERDRMYKQSCRAQDRHSRALNKLRAERDALHGVVKLLRDMHCIPWDDGSACVLRICNRALAALANEPEQN